MFWVHLGSTRPSGPRQNGACHRQRVQQLLALLLAHRSPTPRAALERVHGRKVEQAVRERDPPPLRVRLGSRPTLPASQSAALPIGVSLVRLKSKDQLARATRRRSKEDMRDEMVPVRVVR